MISTSNSDSFSKAKSYHFLFKSPTSCASPVFRGLHHECLEAILRKS